MTPRDWMYALYIAGSLCFLAGSLIGWRLLR